MFTNKDRFACLPIKEQVRILKARQEKAQSLQPKKRQFNYGIDTSKD